MTTSEYDSRKDYWYVRKDNSTATYHLLPDDPPNEAISPSLCGLTPSPLFGGVWAETTNEMDGKRLCPTCLRLAGEAFLEDRDGD